MTTMVNPAGLLAPTTLTHFSLGAFSAVDADTPHYFFGAFQEDALTNSLELDDADAANDIDEFSALLSTVEDEETANDIDAFTDLIESLSKAQTTKSEELSDTGDLLPIPSFTNNDLDVLLGSKTADVYMEDDASDVKSDDDEDEPSSPLDAAAALSPLDFRTYQTPIDPRCCITTSIFPKIDPRIPQILIPRMDVTFGGRALPASPVPALTKTAAAPPALPKATCPSSSFEEDEAYVHDPARCWVCKSGKSEERKMVLHRYVEKRHRRNWKRGARYKARSRVASSRVREGGRFVTKCQWFVPTYE